MIFENLIKENKEQFIGKVISICQKLGVPPEWLMLLMWIETNHTLNHRIQNTILATGLIQIMPATAIGLGTTVDKLKAMSNVEQLDYVYLHLKKFKGKYKTITDLYCAIFWPAAVGKPMDYLITSDTVAKQNRLFDANRDLDISKQEIHDAIIKQIPAEYRAIFA